MKMVRSILIGLVMLGLISNVGYARQKYVQVKGSDTLINLVQRLSEVYMETHPGKAISVTGGGSGTGIAAIINDTADIANASRLMKDKEIKKCVKKGINPMRIVIAIDALSIVINPDNPITDLTVDQIAKIYKGEITNWSEIGGNDETINLYGRQPNSGTYDFMKKHILKGDYSPKMRQMNGNAQIVMGVESDISGIGYVGVGYARSASGIKVVKIGKKEDGPFIDPLTVSDASTYPISRSLQQYVSGEPKGNVKEFIAFELSPKGQEIVEEEGFFPVSKAYKEVNRKAGL